MTTAPRTASSHAHSQQVQAEFELRTALEAVWSTVALRAEERQGGTLHRPLFTDAKDEALPSLAAYGEIGPLAQVIAMSGLTEAEALILTAAVAPAIDDRFAAAYRELSNRPDALGLTMDVARTLAARTFSGRLHATALLGSRAPLRATGLLEGGTGPQDPLTPDAGLAAFVMGMPTPPAVPSNDFPARPLTTVHTLDDVVLPSRARTQVRGLERRIAHRDRVVDSWGFGRHHDGAQGLVALLHGPPGTGKTMTAAALAASAGLPAYVIDLSALVSKFIGETEKSLARVFDRAERERCILVFDEADAVFGSRTEVSDAHDRYANQEVSFLLSRIEQHPGVVVLTTNLLGNIDEAFQRRVHVMVEFPEPGPTEREHLWRAAFPPETPVADDVDLTALAQTFPLTGAQIRDAAIESAYLAADAGGVVTAALLDLGVRRQYAKAGRTAPA